METKKQVTVKFIIGIVIMVVSLVLGKLVMIPLLFFPISKEWKMVMLIGYALSWLMMLVGIFLAGIEGYRLVTHKYKHYQAQTIHHVKKHSKKAAEHTQKAAKKTVKAIRKGAKRTRISI